MGRRVKEKFDQGTYTAEFVKEMEPLAISGVIIGKAIYEGKIVFREALVAVE